MTATHVPSRTAFATGIAAFLLPVAASLLWKRKWRHAPLEWLLRKLAG
ncbi:MAG TPA: DUF418 domain-containing protein [Tepidisphaeraceae bacterium]|jgi:uncharacterized membrane protein YeiB